MFIPLKNRVFTINLIGFLLTIFAMSCHAQNKNPENSFCRSPEFPAIYNLIDKEYVAVLKLTGNGTFILKIHTTMLLSLYSHGQINKRGDSMVLHFDSTRLTDKEYSDYLFRDYNDIALKKNSEDCYIILTQYPFRKKD